MTKEELYHTGADHTFPSGDKLEYGAKGVVVGPATSEAAKGKGLKMRFPGNKDAISVYLTDLSRTPPVRPPRVAARQHACRPLPPPSCAGLCSRRPPLPRAYPTTPHRFAATTPTAHRYSCYC